MKKSSTRTLLIVIGVIIAIALIASFLFMNNAQELSVDAFYEKSGLIFTEDPSSIDQTNQKILYQGDGFVIVDKIKVVASDGTVSYKEKDVTKIVIDGYVLKAYKGNASIYKTVYSRSESETLIINGFMASGLSISYKDPSEGSIFSSIIMPLLTVAIGIVLVIVMIRQLGGGGGKSALDFGKIKAQVISNVKVRFGDVAGAEEEKVELAEIVEFLKTPKKFSDLGAKIPRGVLLVGNPGTGKTLFAKAVAGEAGVPFFSLSGSDFVEMFVGVGASRVRDLFNTAKKNQPCIIFIDEIDAVGRQRGAGLGGGNDEREQTLNQLLVQMDGFEANDGIIVMAATNRADVLDPALLRPGRFDRQIYVNMPDVRGREAILRVHARNKPLAKDVSFKILARMTAGFSGADLANLLNEAAILAARGDRKNITNIDLYEAINKVIIGPQKKSRLVTETDKRITAYHEAGHAILARLLPNCDPVHEVSIIPRGMAAGYTMTRPDSDDDHLTKARLLDDIVMTLGGRVAEEIIIKDISAGASNDILVITRRARKMVTEWGMSEKIGPISYADGEEIFVGRDYQTRSDYSEDKAKTIDSEVEIIIKTAHEKAIQLLTENKRLLDTMARVLIEKETIYSEEVDMIMAGISAEEIIAKMDNMESEGGFRNPLENEVNKEMKESSKSSTSDDDNND